MSDDSLFFLKSKTVLFAEDDIIIKSQITEVLEMLFKKVFSVDNGEKAYEVYAEKFPDMIISDIKMPKMDGLSLVEKIRQHDYNIPIVLLTNFNEKEYLSKAVNLSVDGYIIKPIEFNTLTQTITKAMKRVHPQDSEIIELAEGLSFNFKTQEVYVKDQLVSLGIKELELLKLLIQHHSRTVTKEEISEKLWPLDTISESSIKNLILRIRKKFHDDIIISVRGIGYRLNISSN
ncbi:MAG: response regulator transcription factor [Arcobacter sp.]|uniref:response regulator transcription factor n=1 Tax=Arcobacter sp. TaxID=1872629 RepID=UPI003B005529